MVNGKDNWYYILDTGACKRWINYETAARIKDECRINNIHAPGLNLDYPKYGEYMPEDDTWILVDDKARFWIVSGAGNQLSGKDFELKRTIQGHALDLPREMIADLLIEESDITEEQ